MWRDSLIAIIQYMNLLDRLFPSIQIVKKQVGFVCEDITYGERKFPVEMVDFFHHDTLDGQKQRFRVGIAIHANFLLEVSHLFSVVNGCHGKSLPRSHRIGGVGHGGATA